MTLLRWNLFQAFAITTVQMRLAGSMTTFHPTQTKATPVGFGSGRVFGWQMSWATDICRLLLGRRLSRSPRGIVARLASGLMSLLVVMLVLDGGHLQPAFDGHVHPHAIAQPATIATPSHSTASGCHVMNACGLVIGITNPIPDKPALEAVLHTRPAISNVTDQVGHRSDVPPPRI